MHADRTTPFTAEPLNVQKIYFMSSALRIKPYHNVGRRYNRDGADARITQYIFKASELANYQVISLNFYVASYTPGPLL